MKNFEDLSGKRFGMLTVIEEHSERIQRKRAWVCKCDCGKTHIALGTRLINGNVHSCGCLRYIKATESLTKHGKTNTRLHRIWNNMRNRCYLPTSTEFKNYGARGIEVCEEWNDFQAFYDWAMSHGYRDDLKLERSNNNGNYCPSNCTWATQKEQSRNTRRNRLLEYKGETHCMVDWADIIGIPYSVLSQRITKLNWDVERAFTEPVGYSKNKGDTNG